jgi:hypothetical protein
MCHQIWPFFEQDAPVDGVAWLQHVVEHGSELHPQIIVDALGVLAWIQTTDLADVPRGTALAEQSLSLAAKQQLEVSPWAWIARAMALLYMGEPAENQHAGEQAFAAAQRRGDERAAIVGLCMQIGALESLGENERSAAVAADALHRAEQTGDPVMVAAAVASLTVSYTWGEPDFAAKFDVLSRHAVGLHSGTVNDLWLDINWGETLLGLERPGAIEYLTRAARTADRLNMPHALERTLRTVAIAAAEAGLTTEAATLAGYTEAALLQYRNHQPGQAWIQSRLSKDLSGVPNAPSQPVPHRREIMKLVDDIEDELTEALPAAP